MNSSFSYLPRPETRVSSFPLQQLLVSERAPFKHGRCRWQSARARGGSVPQNLSTSPSPWLPPCTCPSLQSQCRCMPCDAAGGALSLPLVARANWLELEPGPGQHQRSGGSRCCPGSFSNPGAQTVGQDGAGVNAGWEGSLSIPWVQPHGTGVETSLLG